MSNDRLDQLLHELEPRLDAARRSYWRPRLAVLLCAPLIAVVADAANQRHLLRAASLGVNSKVKRDAAHKGEILPQIIVNGCFADGDDFHG